MGRLVAAACELPDGTWKEEMSMVGQTLSMKEITDAIEEISGMKLKREKIDSRELRKRIDAVEGIGKTEGQIIGKLWNQIELITTRDEEDAGRLKPVVNELCTQVKPITVREFLEKVFK